jgi:hypothetical protein
MIEILHFKKGVKIMKLNAAVTNLNVQGNLLATVGEIRTQKRTTLLANSEALSSFQSSISCPAFIIEL